MKYLIALSLLSLTACGQAPALVVSDASNTPDPSPSPIIHNYSFVMTGDGCEVNASITTPDNSEVETTSNQVIPNGGNITISITSAEWGAFYIQNVTCARVNLAMYKDGIFIQGQAAYVATSPNWWVSDHL